MLLKLIPKCYLIQAEFDYLVSVAAGPSETLVTCDSCFHEWKG
jgi:hypothetical protein